MAPPTKPTAPAQPLRSQPSTFSARAEAAISYQFGDLPDWMETLAVFVEDQKEAAEAAAAAAGAAGGFSLVGKSNHFFTVNAGETATEFSSAANSRLKLGAGAVGNPVFTASTQAQAHAALGTAFEHIASDSVTGASLSQILFGVPASYGGFILDMQEFVPSANGAQLLLQVGTGTTASPVWQTIYTNQALASAGAGGNSVVGSATSGQLGMAMTGGTSNSSGLPNSYHVRVTGMNQSGRVMAIIQHGAVDGNLNNEIAIRYSRQDTTATRTVARIIPSSGTISSLKYQIYGVRKF